MAIKFKQLIEMLNELPDEIKNKEFAYLDISHMDENDLEELKQNLLQSDGKYIQACQ